MSLQDIIEHLKLCYLLNIMENK